MQNSNLTELDRNKVALCLALFKGESAGELTAALAGSSLSLADRDQIATAAVAARAEGKASVAAKLLAAVKA